MINNQEKEDLKEILNNLSANVHGKDQSESMIYDWNSLSDEEKNSLLRKYNLYMEIVDHEYYMLGLWVALNISENIAEKLNEMWFESIG